MNLISLYYFTELAKELHMTNTAQKLYITQQNLSQQVVARRRQQKSLHLLPFYQRIQVDQQQNGSQDIPRHRQWYHSIVRMQEGSMLVHLDANLNDYPGFVKANQWE